jgi:hypothetical protein
MSLKILQELVHTKYFDNEQKFLLLFPLKRQYKNLVGLTKDNHTIWSLHKNESTNKTVFNNYTFNYFSDFKVAS